MIIAIGITVITLSSAGIIVYGQLRGKSWSEPATWQRGVLALIFVLGFFAGIVAAGFARSLTHFATHVYSCIIAMALVAFTE